MTVGSLFSGIGGLELGLEMCGVGPVIWQADSDPAARAVLAKHWPEVRRYNDVREIDHEAPPADIICGGFPCQDISVAGAGAGIDGSRSGLWREFARIVRALQPALVFIENVPALATRGLDEVLRDLAESGFDATWDCFSAADVGAPHKRERLFILAYTDGIAGDEGGRGLVERRTTTGEIRGGVAESGGRSHQASVGLADAQGNGRSQGQPESAGRPRRSAARTRGDSGAMADTDSGRREREREQKSDRLESPYGHLADRRGYDWRQHRFPPGPAEINKWDGAQPAVRRSDAGIPAGLDRGWRTKNRVADRLRLLGNSCGPQQAALAWRTLTARALATRERAA